MVIIFAAVITKNVDYSRRTASVGLQTCAEHALSLSTEATTLALRDKLPHIASRGGRVLIIGGGIVGTATA